MMREFKKKLEGLDDDSKEDDENIRQYVKDIVPTYKPNKVIMRRYYNQDYKYDPIFKGYEI